MKLVRLFTSIILLIAAAGALGLLGWGTVWSEQRQGGSAMSFTLSSTAFQPGGDIPRKYTCGGPNVSPELTWTNPPAGTQSFALIADDPDAPARTWVHWVAYGLPAGSRQLPEAVPRTEAIPGGGVQGQNDFRKTGYGGPCPPPGKPHRYYFKLYALDSSLDLKPGATKKAVEQAMAGHILAQAEVMGRFQR
jgi:Raf kinase inhibitor-like YbhB/YbcL family protein